MATKRDWFSVDKEGLAKQLANVPSWRLIAELLSNAWDEKSTQVILTIEPAIIQGYFQVTVEDNNAQGFSDLSHAWTLFAPSAKGGNAEQRGRFNLGEKLLLAAARSAVIRTTSGRVSFDDTGRKFSASGKTNTGSSVAVTMKLRDGVDFTVANLKRLVPPVDTTLVVRTRSGESRGLLSMPHTLDTLTATLPTVVTNSNGELTRSDRITTIKIHAADSDHPPAIYELGVPVVDVDLPWSVDVQQKVPLNRDRDNVTPGYLAELRVLVFNAMHDRMNQDDFRSDWARAAAGDEAAAPDAVTTSLDVRFGKDRVAYDPSDPEANRIAVTKGYTVVSGGAMSSGEWRNAKAMGAIAPAGQVTPSPKPFSPDGSPLQWSQNITDGMVCVQRVVNALGLAVFNHAVGTRFADDPDWHFNGACGPSSGVILNVALKPGREGWFNLRTNLIGVMDLVIHELGHLDGSSHLSEAYYRNLTKLGATAVELMRVHPHLFTDDPTTK